MKNVLNILVAGANGKMGKQIIALVADDPDLKLTGASERADSPVLGADAGLNSGTRQLSVSITSDLRRAMERGSGVLIDFSSVENSLENIRRAVEHGIPVVLGTTGFDAEARRSIEAAAKKIPILMAPNMSAGMNTMFRLAAEAARILKEEFDAEIFEIHHREKIDAPSGTAVKLAKVLCETLKKDYERDVVTDRGAKSEPRKPGQIGVQALRGGDVVGEHTVLFCGSGERLEIRHVATSRVTFAAGAIRAAKWLQNRPAGFYDMEHVLGIGKGA